MQYADDQIRSARWQYQFRLSRQYPDRCVSCLNLAIHDWEGTGVGCGLLQIAIARPAESGCPLYTSKKKFDIDITPSHD